MKKRILFALCSVCVAVVIALVFFFCHFYSLEVVAASCENEGYSKSTCKLCRKTVIEDIVPPFGHVEREWIIDVQNTCTEDGYRHTECNRCNEMISEDIIPAQHQYALAELLTVGEDYPAIFACDRCDDSYEAGAGYKAIGLPVLNLTGDISQVSKKNTVEVGVQYFSEEQSFKCNATLKVQGSTSALYPKKDYTIKFMDDEGKKKKISFADSWGEESKYCMKANWIDVTEARNVVSAKIWGQIVRSREKDDELDSLVNGGAIDGFPIVVYLNSEFLGLYTMNIPKDAWLFGMEGDEESKEAILFQGGWSDSGKLLSTISINPEIDELPGSWEIEYCSTEDESWVIDSFNEFIEFLNVDDGEYFKEHVNEYTDFDRVTDVFIYTFFIGGLDNVSKNMIWVTYDGKHWIPSMYDLDSTWGLQSDGTEISWYTWPLLDMNMLFYNLIMYCRDDLCVRIGELLDTVLSKENLDEQFETFITSIPEVVYKAEADKWPNAPRPEGNDLAGIEKYIDAIVNYYTVKYVQ